jgi:hypothetical protein
VRVCENEHATLSLFGFSLRSHVAL